MTILKKRVQVVFYEYEKAKRNTQVTNSSQFPYRGQRNHPGIPNQVYPYALR